MRHASLLRLVAVVATVAPTRSGSSTASGDQWDAAAERAYARLDAQGDVPTVLRHRPAIARRGDGVVYAVGGSSDFVDQEVLPCVRYLLRLGARTRYALFYERHLLGALEPGDAADVRRLFDVLTAYEDVELPALRGAFKGDVRLRVKSVKAHAFLFAPFERFVYLDFDSRPCRPDFAARLLGDLKQSGADAVLHDQWTSQRFMPVDKHYRVEHNSAVAAFDATSPRTAAALGWFVAAFAELRLRRDQPALMVGLRLARERRGFGHVDVDNGTFCRANNSAVVSCDAGCDIVHKPMKYDPGNLVVAVGARGTGNVALRRALAHLKLVNRDPACDGDGAAPETCKVLVGLRWSRAYAAIAARYPRAKFVLTTSTDPCPDEAAHNARVRAALPAHAVFDLDLAAAREPDWRRFCAFVEAWSSCKTRDLAKTAASWLRARAPTKAC